GGRLRAGGGRRLGDAEPRKQQRGREQEHAGGGAEQALPGAPRVRRRDLHLGILSERGPRALLETRGAGPLKVGARGSENQPPRVHPGSPEGGRSGIRGAAEPSRAGGGTADPLSHAPPTRAAGRSRSPGWGAV